MLLFSFFNVNYECTIKMYYIYFSYILIDSSLNNKDLIISVALRLDIKLALKSPKYFTHTLALFDELKYPISETTI